MKVIIINGKPRTGKDTFCKIYAQFNLSIDYSSIERIKEIMKEFGWNGKKTPEMRKALSDLKDFATKYFDLPYKLMSELILDMYNNGGHYDLILHIREPEEIGRIVNFCRKNDVSCYTVLVKRKNKEKITNHADKNVNNYDYNFVIENDGTIEDFTEKIIEFDRKLKGLDIIKYYP